MDQKPSFSPKRKVEVLLKEYETLRAEILGRINRRFGITGYVIGGVAAVASLSTFSTSAIVVIAVVGGSCLLGLWWRSWHLIRNCQRRIAEIENHINRIADDELLVWESRGRVKYDKIDAQVRSFVHRAAEMINGLVIRSSKLIKWIKRQPQTSSRIIGHTAPVNGESSISSLQCDHSADNTRRCGESIQTELH